MSDDEDYMIDDDDNDEVLIGDDGDDSPNYIGISTNSDEIPKVSLLSSISSILEPQIDQLSKLLPNFHPVNNHNSTITFQVPSNIIPSSLQMVCGYYISPILIEVTLTFKEANWNRPLATFSATHPVFNQNYIGRPLIYDTIRHFFRETYKPQGNYRSSKILFSQGSYGYDTSPLLYLIFEIVDCFLDIQDHCCICHSKLPFSVIKPSICDKKLCEVGFNEIGVGTSVAQEIRRDTNAADLLLSIFACTHPKPPSEVMSNMANIFKNLPPMKAIASSCRNDADIVKNIGKESLDLLRWVLLSNRSQLIHLPDELKLKEVGFPNQFMTLIASPQHEEAFQRKKNRNQCHDHHHQKKKKKISKSEINSIFLWHGSGGERWHSIIRNGLMNMSNKDCVNGAAHGPGIYLAKDVHTSLSYIKLVKNLYKNSELGPYLSLIALCEVIPNEKYKDVGSIATLQDEEAIIVRFVFPIISKNPYFDDDYDMNYHGDYDNDNDDDYDNDDFSSYYDIRAGKITSGDIPKIENVLRYLEMKNKKVKK